MERKQRSSSFFTSLKNDVVRGLSPSRSRTGSPMSRFFQRKTTSTRHVDALAVGSASLRPVMEGPDPYEGETAVGSSGLGQWVKGQLGRTHSSLYKRRFNNNDNDGDDDDDLRLLLCVMGAPLGPLHVSSTDPLPLLSVKDTPIESSSAQYILQQYVAATGGQKVQDAIHNAYAMGKVRMVTSEMETATKVVKTRNSARDGESGGFVLWRMNPDKWYVELAVGGSKLRAGSNGKLVWRHTSWQGSHTAKGPVRPLRRALQGLDPRTTANMFSDAICTGEKNINGEDCFILKLCADSQTLKARSEGPAEIIRHVLFGYFSQKTGLLVLMEDSHLTRIQSNGGDTVYWETTINSFLDDYRPVEGIMIAHSGRSIATLFRFGEIAMSHTKTRMEETWTIDEVAFNVPGLSVDCFIPPADLRSGSITGACEHPKDDKAIALAALHWAKVAALEKARDSDTDSFSWKMGI